MIRRITPIIKAIWISQPKLRKKIKPSSHKTRIIIPIINKILIATSLIFYDCYFYLRTTANIANIPITIR